MNNELQQHTQFMKLAVQLAKRATRAVSPNPRVGAVVVSGDTVVGKGYHKKSGGPHAEVFALRQAGERARNATLYITLEPCSTHGKTPPCTDAIIASGIKTVVIGTIDPNPKHAGKAIDILENKGIKVVRNILEHQCNELIEDFRVHTLTAMPFTIVKIATSLDGKIATHTGQSKWITSPASRSMVQQIRSNVDAILVGATTVVRDNPSLTVRQGRKQSFQPYRLVLDPLLQTPRESKLVTDEYKDRTIIITDEANINTDEYNFLIEEKIRLLPLPCLDTAFSNKDILQRLAQLGIVSLLIEGGGTTVGHFFDNRLINKVYCFIAPKIIGGHTAPGSFNGLGVANINDAVQFDRFVWKKRGDDIVLCGYPRWTTT